MSERYLQIDKVRMVFETRKGPFCALEEISLDIRAGEFVSLIGHSGCGKSTLLNIVTGLLQPSEGDIFLANPGGGNSVILDHVNTVDEIFRYGKQLDGAAAFAQRVIFAPQPGIN